MYDVLSSQFDAKEADIRASISKALEEQQEPGLPYDDCLGPEQLFNAVFSNLKVDTWGGLADCEIDLERTTIINHGDYQGTLLFIFTESGYQPSHYWAATYNYGSCSGCDALQSIGDDLDQLMVEARNLVNSVVKI